jgi:hypothetical protein
MKSTPVRTPAKTPLKPGFSAPSKRAPKTSTRK